MLRLWWLKQPKEECSLMRQPTTSSPPSLCATSSSQGMGMPGRPGHAVQHCKSSMWLLGGVAIAEQAAITSGSGHQHATETMVDHASQSALMEQSCHGTGVVTLSSHRGPCVTGTAWHARCSGRRSCHGRARYDCEQASSSGLRHAWCHAHSSKTCVGKWLPWQKIWSS